MDEPHELEARVSRTPQGRSCRQLGNDVRERSARGSRHAHDEPGLGNPAKDIVAWSEPADELEDGIPESQDADGPEAHEDRPNPTPPGIRNPVSVRRQRPLALMWSLCVQSLPGLKCQRIMPPA